jgi:hypothetical protein
MKHFIRHSWALVIGSVAFLLAACQQQGQYDANRAQFQMKAAATLSKISATISKAKATTASNVRGFSTDGSSWVPYNNTFIQADPTNELKDAEAYLATLPMTRANFQTRIIIMYQAAVQTYHTMNPLDTNMYRNLNTTGQQYMGYSDYWRYPGSFQNFQPQVANSQWLSGFMNQGFVQNPIRY